MRAHGHVGTMALVGRSEDNFCTMWAPTTPVVPRLVWWWLSLTIPAQLKLKQEDHHGVKVSLCKNDFQDILNYGISLPCSQKKSINKLSAPLLNESSFRPTS